MSFIFSTRRKKEDKEKIAQPQPPVQEERRTNSTSGTADAVGIYSFLT
jgi:hypothetical protein